MSNCCNYFELIVAGVCGGALFANSSAQTLTSPNYPQNYPLNLRCRWVFDAPESEQVEINVTDLALEYHSSCHYDYLEFNDYPVVIYIHHCLAFIGSFDGILWWVTVAEWLAHRFKDLIAQVRIPVIPLILVDMWWWPCASWSLTIVVEHELWPPSNPCCLV